MEGFRSGPDPGRTGPGLGRLLHDPPATGERDDGVRKCTVLMPHQNLPAPVMLSAVDGSGCDVEPGLEAVKLYPVLLDRLTRSRHDRAEAVRSRTPGKGADQVCGPGQHAFRGQA